MLKASVITPPPKKREKKKKQSRQEAIEESLKIVIKMLKCGSSQLMTSGRGWRRTHLLKLYKAQRKCLQISYKD